MVEEKRIEEKSAVNKPIVSKRNKNLIFFRCGNTRIESIWLLVHNICTSCNQLINTRAHQEFVNKKKKMQPVDSVRGKENLKFSYCVEGRCYLSNRLTKYGRRCCNKFLSKLSNPQI